MTKPTRPFPSQPETPPPGTTEGPDVIYPVPYTAPSYFDDPQVMLAVSTDGGITFSEYVPRSMGKVGQYRQRLTWDRLGSGDNIVLKFALADPAPLTVYDLDVTLEGGRK